MKRSGCAAIMAAFCRARARMAWCMVGTAVYQVGRACSIQPKNFKALNPGVQKMLLPADRGASTAAMSPWM